MEYQRRHGHGDGDSDSNDSAADDGDGQVVFLEDRRHLLQQFVFGRILMTESSKCCVNTHAITFYGHGDKSLEEFLCRPDLSKEVIS